MEYGETIPLPHQSPSHHRRINSVFSNPSRPTTAPSTQRLSSNIRKNRGSKKVQKTSAKAKDIGTRGHGFGAKEVSVMLDIIEQLLPLCREEWEKVACEHGKIFPQSLRTADSLKRKFPSLHRRRMPTGDAFIPDDVRRAKAIRIAMTERADLGTGEEVDEDFVESGNALSITTPLEEVDMRKPGTCEEGEFVKEAAASGSEPLPKPRPLVQHRASRSLSNSRSKSSSADDDFISLYKLSMIQEQTRREEESLRREEERKADKERREEERHLEKERREEERRQDRVRRDEESRRHSQMMEMMMLVITQNLKKSG